MNILIFWFLVNNASIHLTLQLQQEGILQSRFMWHMTNFSISPSPRRVFPEVRIWLAQELMCSQKLDAECCSWSAQQQHALSWQEFALQEMDSLLCDLFRAPANHLRSCEFVINIHEAHIIFVITEKRYGFGCSVSSGRVGGLANRHPECSLRVFFQRCGRNNISAIWKPCHARADGKVGHEFVIYALSTNSQVLVMILFLFQSTNKKHTPLK